MTKDFINSPFWTLPQAIVWIACRDAERASKDALSPKNSAHEAARAALWKMLRSGEVRANGKRNGERREIQPVEWLDLALGKASARPFLSGGGHGLFPGKNTVALASIVFDSNSVTSAAKESRRRTITYADVRIASDGILQQWPDIVKPPSGEAKAPGRPRAIRDKIEEKMIRDARAGYDLAGATEEELRTKYGTKSRNPVRDARKNALSKIAAK
ncbi:hypothetical protein AMST5_04081 [freshwater sediment metagenome]|uniref:Uncharacterized protein n=1 Tax=freshwater sediment metagenome TaxID=556182 RepID=A0AA48RFA2_9ZZZZ